MGSPAALGAAAARVSPPQCCREAVAILQRRRAPPEAGSHLPRQGVRLVLGEREEAAEMPGPLEQARGAEASALVELDDAA